MLIFNEGLPRAGKSYDAVKSHIVPAIKSKRHVYARLNGLSFYAIAQVAGVGEDVVREYLHLVEHDQVLDLFKIKTIDKQKMLNPALERDALFVIDECHEFYVKSSRELDPEIENFFAYHGQFGMDGVLISQWYKRVHSAIRGRVERKHLFRKLSFLKLPWKKVDNKKQLYVCRQQIATEPDKFSVLSSDQHEYEPVYYSCYRSYQPGSSNTDVYDPGFGAMFSRLQKGWLIFLVVALVLSGALMLSKYSALKSARAAEKTQKAATTKRESMHVVASPGAAKSSGATVMGQGKSRGDFKHSPVTSYFFDLTRDARPRLAVYVKWDGKQFAEIEWRSGNFNVLDRVDTRTLERLGMVVVYDEKIVTVSADGETFVATPWPIDSPYSVSPTQMDRLSPPSPAAMSVPSSTSMSTPTGSGAPRIGTNYTPIMGSAP